MNLRRPGVALAVAILTLVTAAFAGCGGESTQVSEEQALVEKAIKAALAGQYLQFLSLVAPSFVEEARREMPDATDEEIGGVLVAGLLKDLPFQSIRQANYEVETNRDKAVVHVWGGFLDFGGEEIDISEVDALRIPLVYEAGHWYLDLLDL